MFNLDKHFFLKMLFVILAGLAFLVITNLLSLAIGYTPHVVIVYVLGGGYLAYLVTTTYDKVVLNKSRPEHEETRENIEEIREELDEIQRTIRAQDRDDE